MFQGEYKSTSKHIKINGLECDPWQTNVHNCGVWNGTALSLMWGIGSCEEKVSPWVSCYKFRLVDDTDQNNRNKMLLKKVNLQDIQSMQGRLEIYDPMSSKHYHSICGNNFGQNEANLVCRHLGFNWGTVKKNAHFGQGRGEIAFDNVDCDYEYYGEVINVEIFGGCGKEGEIGRSILETWGEHRCGHGEDVGLVCSV